MILLEDMILFVMHVYGLKKLRSCMTNEYMVTFTVYEVEKCFVNIRADDFQ